MEYTKEEQLALKKFGLTDFKNISKKKMLSIASSINEVEPEVAQSIINQFSNYKDAVCNIVTEYKDIVEKSIGTSENSAKVFFEAKQMELDILNRELQREELTSEERFDILDRISRVTREIDMKDSEIRKFAAGVIKVVGTMVIGVAIGAITSVLGSHFNIGAKIDGYDDDEDDDEDD